MKAIHIIITAASLIVTASAGLTGEYMVAALAVVVAATNIAIATRK